MAISLYTERHKNVEMAQWPDLISEQFFLCSSSFYVGRHSLCLFPERILDHVLLTGSNVSSGPGTGMNSAQRDGSGDFTGIFHPQLSAPSGP